LHIARSGGTGRLAAKRDVGMRVHRMRAPGGQGAVAQGGGVQTPEQTSADAVQSWHVRPFTPQASSSVPPTHVPFSAALQQPPLHGVTFGVLHSVTQRKIPARRQARPPPPGPPGTQWLAAVHPQWPSTHWFPAEFDVQSAPLVHCGIIVVLVVVLTGVAGAQRSLEAIGWTTRLPNWSFSATGGSASLAHFSL
jgi:hypothetical protein